ncbi:MAG: double zinc ribbon domain-containing protein [Deferrisomatales bacterium]
MNCSACQHINAPGRNYCGSCGAPLGQYCRFCGFRNLAADRFCGGCGTALGAEAPQVGSAGGEPTRAGSAPAPPMDLLSAELLAAAREAVEEVPSAADLHVTQDDIDSLFGG